MLGAAVTGAVTGAVVGGITAALVDFSGIPEEDARGYEAITAGVTSAEVLSRIGKPATTWPIPRQRQMVHAVVVDLAFDAALISVGQHRVCHGISSTRLLLVWTS